MGKAQYGILRFAKYKGPEIGHIEAHNERTKEQYASNPDVDTGRSQYNFHLVTPDRKYRTEAEKQIAEAGCKTRSDSVRVVEALVTASPEFFKGKKKAEVKAYFAYALDFIKAHQSEKTIISAVVHMDEKTPHMHLCFVPLTEDGRLSAKDIVGNRKKLTWWQDEFWKHMTKKYPELERGESVSRTGREHLPPRLYKEAVHLSAQRDRLMELLSGTNAFNAKARAGEIAELLDEYIPGVEKFKTKIKKAFEANRTLITENEELKSKIAKAEEAGKERIAERLERMKRDKEYAELLETVERIPPEILEAYTEVRASRESHEFGEAEARADHKHPINGIMKENKGKHQGIGG